MSNTVPFQALKTSSLLMIFTIFLVLPSYIEIFYVLSTNLPPYEEITWGVMSIIGLLILSTASVLTIKGLNALKIRGISPGILGGYILLTLSYLTVPVAVGILFPSFISRSLLGLLVFLCILTYFIGNILLGYSINKIGEAYSVKTLKRAGKFLMLSFLFGLFALLGFILSYLGFSKLQKTTPTVVQQNMIYQTGPIAQLRSNGITVFQVYSFKQAQLIGAVIEGTNYSAIWITPNFVYPNQITNITINFGQLNLPQGTYRIIVTALIDNSLVTFPVYATFLP